ncbi:heme-copper oxidase subunit III [bacterium]|nr:heme-copper oxidase subunit III [bacterium]
MWLFLATEIMFFTGLIGSYVVLRIGSKKWVTPYTVEVRKTNGDKVEGESRDDSKDPLVLTSQIEGEPEIRVPRAEIAKAADGSFEIEHRDPLNIPLTAANTFFLICSSVTMVMALAAIQRGDRAGLHKFLWATILIGALFVSIQVYEYRKLIHEGFVPAASIFASCFYVMTGCHGAHVSGGVIYLTGIQIAAYRGKFSKTENTTVELAGLYWHFVDLVWIILFTVVYLI